MIQRIQSVFLFLATLVLLGLYVFPLVTNVNIDGIISNVNIMGIYQQLPDGKHYTTEFTALKFVAGLVALLPAVIIFLYKNRKQQIALCYSAILVIIGYSFWMAQTVKAAGGGIQASLSNMGIGMFLSSIAVLLIVLALRAIRRDEKLVRSADRLR